MTDMYNEYAETLTRLIGAPNVQICDVSQAAETHAEFTERMIRDVDRMLGVQNPLDPIQILYRKAEDQSITLEAYIALMRAARYLYDQSHPAETEMEFELRSPRNPFVSLHRH